MTLLRPAGSIKPLPIPQSLTFGVHAKGGTGRIDLVGFTVTRTCRLHQSTGGVADPPVHDEVLFSLEASAPKLERDPVMERILSTYSQTRGNLEPSDEDYVNDFIFRREQELDDILAKIKNVEATIHEHFRSLAKLCCAAMHKRNEMAVVAPLMPPIRALPPELLRIIFEMTVSQGDRVLRSHTAPLLLCRVCQLWRDIAIMTPTLWSSVAVDGRFVRSVDNCMNILDLAAERAGDAPLGLDLREHVYQDSNISPPELLFLLAPSFSRYQDLRLSVQTASWYNDLLHFSPSKVGFQKLERLTLLVNHHELEQRRGQLTVPALHLFKAAPLLTRVRLDLKHPGGSLKIHLPYSQLLDLDYRLTLRVPNSTSYAVKCWQATIACGTSLISASLTLLSSPTIYGDHPTLKPPENAKSRSSDITEFMLTNGVAGNAGLIFRNLALPKLRKLSFQATRPCQVIVDGDIPATETHYFQINPLISTLFHNLESLTLLRVLISDAQLFSLLRCIPNIRHFGLLPLARCSACRPPRIFAPQDSALVHYLTVPALNKEASEKADYLLPKLEELEIFYPCHEGSARETLIKSYGKLVKTRAETNKRRGIQVSSRRANIMEPFLFKFSLILFEEFGGSLVAPQARKTLYAVGTEECPISVSIEVVKNLSVIKGGAEED